MSVEPIHSTAWSDRRWISLQYGRLQGIPELTNISILAFVAPDVYHKVHHHWHQFQAPHPLWHPVLGTLYILIGLLSLLGNGIVIWVFAMTRSLRSGTNLLMINLAVSDLLMMLSNFPILVINCFNQTWSWGPIACEVYGFCGALFGTVSIISLALIAYDRYRAIVTPFSGRQLSFRRATLWLTGTWVYGLVWCSLPFFGWNQYVLEGFLTSCTFDYLSNDLWSKSYVVVLFVAVYLMPLIVIGCCYVLIVLSVCRHNDDILVHQRQQGEGVKYTNLKHRENQLARVVFTSIFFWTLAWTPYAVVSLMGVLSWHSAITPLATMLPALFAKLSTIYNPVIYTVSHPKFRQELGRRLPWLCCVLPLSIQPSSSFHSSIRSGTITAPFLSRSSSLVSQRNEKANVDLPNLATIMQDLSTVNY